MLVVFERYRVACMYFNCSTTIRQVAWRCCGSVSLNASLLPGFTVGKQSPRADFTLLTAHRKFVVVNVIMWKRERV